ncbi:MAG: hypothetical protein KIS94_05620 [Chitinophagales bacterium]|nr:hypothetical protein [Chitinophagales bacterium]
MAAAEASEYIDTKMLVTLLVVFLIIVILVVLWNKFMTPNPPSGSISPADYNKLSSDEQKLWKLDPNGSGWYVKA